MNNISFLQFAFLCQYTNYPILIVISERDEHAARGALLKSNESDTHLCHLCMTHRSYDMIGEAISWKILF